MKKSTKNYFINLKIKLNIIILKNSKKKLNSWEKESFQRNQIEVGLKEAKKEDIIMISDVDEIPNLNGFDFSNVKDYVFAFSQLHSMYKLNLIRNENWIGTKLCKKEIFTSPQWLRALKVKKKVQFFTNR